MSSQWFRDNAERFSGQLLFDEPLAKYTYYRIGGPASVFAAPKSIEDLQWLAEGIRATGIPLFVMGMGSNLLVSDQGFSGLIVRATRLNLETVLLGESTTSNLLRIRTGGSVAVSSLLRRAATEGWGGLGMLAGVPGAIGGAVTMNAGTHLGEVKDRLRRVEVFSLLSLPATSRVEPTVFDSSQLKFEYRRNLFLPKGSIVWAAEWEVRKEDPAKVKAQMDETLARRKATQPIDYPSCGSIFKNPSEGGMSAWKVVDQLGLRGHRIGGAQFAEKHSNFIINLGGATASDVMALIELVKGRALKELGITLHEEVMYVG